MQLRYSINADPNHKFTKEEIQNIKKEHLDHYTPVSYTHLSTTYTDHFILYFSHNMTFCHVFLSCQYVKELLLLCNRS